MHSRSRSNNQFRLSVLDEHSVYGRSNTLRESEPPNYPVYSPTALQTYRRLVPFTKLHIYKLLRYKMQDFCYCVASNYSVSKYLLYLIRIANILKYQVEELDMATEALTKDDAIFRIDEEEIRKVGIASSGFEEHEQPRAISALRIGSKLRGKGYNIFVCGRSGTGRLGMIYKVLRELSSDRLPIQAKEIALVHNFKVPSNPKPLYFSPGEAKRFKKELEKHLQNLQKQIGQKLESSEYNKIKDDIISSVEEREKKILDTFEERLKHEGLSYTNKNDPVGMMDLSIIHNDNPISFTQFKEEWVKGEVEEARFQSMQKRYFEMKINLQAVFRALLRSKGELASELEVLKVITSTPEIHLEMESLKLDFPDPGVHAYLEALADDIANNINDFLSSRDDAGSPPHGASHPRYMVNILYSAETGESQPIIHEVYPTYKNLLGHLVHNGTMDGYKQATHMDIQGGSIFKAHGGFLILSASDLLKEDRSWKYLKKALRTGGVTIVPEEHQTNGLIHHIIPEEIKVDVKLILIGEDEVYELLLQRDPEFHEYFKVIAEFDSVMPRNKSTMALYLDFISKEVSRRNGLKLDTDAKAEVIRYGARRAEDRNKLSTLFSEIRDLLIEAEYWAFRVGAIKITGEIIRTALEQRRYRFNLAEEKLNEHIASGDISIPLGEPQVGQVNALAVSTRGNISFGTPCHISATTSPGDTGIINIEGEVGLSGEIHDKWVHIMEGFLRMRYSPNFPLTLHGTICFEQSYGQIDGDSASVAEMSALLSAISGVPLKQTIAVTGSLGQSGQIQAVGGVTEKVEGFFETCSRKGLNGNHGVIIPCQNVKNLILPMHIECAISDGMFAVFAVSSLDEVLNILSSLPSGELGENLEYPEGSFNYLVKKQLKWLHQQGKKGDSPGA